MWSNWSIYWTLDNFSKHLTTINLPKSPTFLGNLATLYWSHCWVLSSLNNLIVKHMRNVTSMHVLNKYVWLFINTTTAFLFGRYCFASPSTYSSFVIKNVVCFKCQLPLMANKGSKSAWPDVGIKRLPLFYQCCQKRSHGRFYIKCNIFQTSPKYMGNFC